MCGIWAAFGNESDDTVKERIREHLATGIGGAMAVRHRGPDCSRIKQFSPRQMCILAFHRLSINDEENGMQPFTTKRYPHLWLIFNGEIYNSNLIARELGFQYDTSMDGECILHLYNRGGIELVARLLDGVFAACLLDTNKKQVHILRDTFGVKPLYKVSTIGGTLALCSEGKGLSDIFPDSEISQLLPGYTETYRLHDAGHVTLRKVQRHHSIGAFPLYKTLVSIDGGVTEDKICSNIRELIKGAVKKRLLAGRKICCMLSGGLDSSLAAALAMDQASEEGIAYRLETYTIGMPGSPDLISARTVAKHIGSDHHELILTVQLVLDALTDAIYHLETYDPPTIRASVGMYLISKFISQSSDSVVVFSGEGADEVCQGYRHFHDAFSPDSSAAESQRLCDNLHMFCVLRADRMTAGHGLEVRLHFLDHQFSAYYMSLPPDLRQPRYGMEKYLLRKAFDNSNLLPQDILWRPKAVFSEGLSSETETLFDILQNYCETKVSDEDLADAVNMFPFNPPEDKQGYYYRQVFEQIYPCRENWTPFCWKPWTGTLTDTCIRI